MSGSLPLHFLLERSAAAHPRRVAVQDPGTGRTITYEELDRLAGRLRDRLRRLGVGPGDRVGFYLRKSIDSIASIYGILRAGATYVPLDPGAPAARNAYILDNCSVAAVIVERGFVESLEKEFATLGAPLPSRIAVAPEEGPVPLARALEAAEEADRAPQTASHPSDADELAYILYTSGSTGKPKGVMLSHRNAVSFVDWCSEVFEPSAEDSFSSHAPLHFDLSILDVHVAIKHGARLVLVGEEVGKDPARLAPLIAEARITVWYSAPSILALLAQYGKLERRDYSALRLVLFAGEVFPVKHLRALKQLLPHPRYFNLYGPTETNVCTFYEIPAEIDPDRAEPYPIGKACSHLESIVIDEAGKPVEPGQEGELCIRGAGVTRGYWNLPENNARAFHVDAAGVSWYRTGDIVVEAPGGDYIFHGRRDRMVKKRGYRIELGEIEACLYRHPSVREVGVLASTDSDGGVLIKAFLGIHDQPRPSIIALKTFCAERLPLYMVPDRFEVHEHLPRTSTAKVDYQALKQRL